MYRDGHGEIRRGQQPPADHVVDAVVSIEGQVAGSEVQADLGVTAVEGASKPKGPPKVLPSDWIVSGLV